MAHTKNVPALTELRYTAVPPTLMNVNENSLQKLPFVFLKIITRDKE